MNQMCRVSIVSAVLIASALLVSCAKKAIETSPALTIRPPSMADDTPRDFAGLHNVVAYREGCLSGSVPEGDKGFDTLAAMGVTTIISVDGAEPDVARARAHGLRYIHLPIGYNGFDDERKLQLVRATRDALRDGPVYLHCHHGKHRSAGAAAAIGVSLGWGTQVQMIDRMKVSGTSPNYRGLYACARNAKVIPASAIDAVPADFPEVSHPAGFVKAMIEIDEINERLKLIEKANWRIPEDHPDLVPVAEAGQLADLLRLMAGSERAKREPAGFAASLRLDEKLATSLEEMLADNEQDKTLLSARLAQLNQSCKECHAKYRD